MVADPGGVHPSVRRELAREDEFDWCALARSWRLPDRRHDVGGVRAEGLAEGSGGCVAGTADIRGVADLASERAPVGRQSVAEHVADLRSQVTE